MVTSYTTLLARRYKGKLDSDADAFINYAVDAGCCMEQLIQVCCSIAARGSGTGVVSLWTAKSYSLARSPTFRRRSRRPAHVSLTILFQRGRRTTRSCTGFPKPDRQRDQVPK